jgi:hypothetical protein
VHPAVRIALRHFLMKDAAAGGHPLDVPRAERTAIAEAVPMFDLSGQDIGDGLDTAVRVPGEAGAVVFRVLVPEIVEQQERIELSGVPESKRPLQLDPGAFAGGFGLHDSLDRSHRHDVPP